jgi:hypothetical protein
MTAKLADHLRALDDHHLGALLRARPDLAVPVPSDVSALAARAQTRVSVARALDGLDQFTLEILDGLRFVRGEAGRGTDAAASVEALLSLVGGTGVEAADVRAAVDRLTERALAYGPPQQLRLVRAIDELCSPYPAGLGRTADELGAPEVASLVKDAAKVRRTLLAAPPEARAVLDRLAAGPPIGTVSAGTLRSTDDGQESPVRWLVANRLLVAISDDTVELPREVGLVLRRDAGPLGTLHPAPPRIDGPVRPRKAVDSAGAGQALEAIRHVDALVGGLAETTMPVLKSGGIGVRELRRLAREAGIPDQVGAVLLEIGFAAGLLAASEPTGRTHEQRWLPTPAYDTWRSAPLARRWVVLARAWLDMPRAASMVGLRDDKDRPINALSEQTYRLGASVARRAALAELAALPVGTAPDPDPLLGRLAWRAPRRTGGNASTGPAALSRAALAEAAMLGVTGSGALTSFGRVLATEDRRDPDADPLGVRTPSTTDELITAVAALLPPPVEHVLVQADLTVVVPGPPEPGLAAELALIADTESRGGATVYRVTADSVRRALDGGYAAGDLHALFQRRSRTALPQALTYLIDDVARRHGGLRGGPANAYLRSDDEALLAQVFADKRLAGLALRRLAPTVLITSHPTGRMIEALRDAGYAPVPEDASGATILVRPTSARTAARPLPRSVRPEDFEPPRLSGPRLDAVVEQVRVGDRLARAARRPPVMRGRLDLATEPTTPAQAHTQALAVLQQALRDQAMVWVGYVDAHGGTAAKLVRPVSMGAGYLRAEDERTEMLHTFALHRITSAVLEE